MGITTKDVVSLSQARAKLTELCDEVLKNGTEKLITKNGSSYAALIEADRLDHYHRLEREHIHLGLLEEAIKGLTDLKGGKTLSLAQLKLRHGR
ncbi:MAG: type II toxin-antitoxin system Phd/YefM family antitoxin [Nitrospiraceae bacterium]